MSVHGYLCSSAVVSCGEMQYTAANMIDDAAKIMNIAAKMTNMTHTTSKVDSKLITMTDSAGKN